MDCYHSLAHPRHYFWNLITKEAIDRALSAIIILFTAPLLILITCAIKLSSDGNAFRRQVRLGLGKREFILLGFRTCYCRDCDEVCRTCREMLIDDTRINDLGRFLRISRLDKLPQFLNVFQGEMSLVGPRPNSVTDDGKLEKESGDYAELYNVKPGITGWAQVNGLWGEARPLDGLRKQVLLDLYYVRNRSIRFDAYILARALFWNKEEW